MEKGKTTGKTAAKKTQGQVDPTAEGQTTTSSTENQGTGEDQQLDNQSNVDANPTGQLDSTEANAEESQNLGEGKSTGNGEATQEVVPDAPKKALLSVKQESKAMQRFRKIASDYAKHYPNNKAFHFCSDGQVFLGRDLAEATTRQNELDGTQRVITIEIE